MDNIKLTGMEFFGYHGALAEENKLGQRFLVDLELYLDLHQAGAGLLGLFAEFGVPAAANVVLVSSPGIGGQGDDQAVGCRESQQAEQGIGRGLDPLLLAAQDVLKRKAQPDDQQGVSDADETGWELNEAGQGRQVVSDPVPFNQAGGQKQPKAAIKRNDDVGLAFLARPDRVDDLDDKGVGQPVSQAGPQVVGQNSERVEVQIP